MRSKMDKKNQSVFFSKIIFFAVIFANNYKLFAATPIPEEYIAYTNDSTSVISTRIYNGVNKDPSIEPFLVYIVKRDPQDSNKYEQCGGSILNSGYILTAAHCIAKDRNAAFQRRLFVWAGAPYDVNKVDVFQPNVGQYIAVKNVYIHPNYQNPEYYDNDIAVYELEQPIDVNKYRTICILRGRWDNQINVLLGGWGKYNCNHNNIFKQAIGYTMDSNDCRNLYKTANINIQTDRQLCARLIGQEGRHAEQANGDSGGPLFIDRNNQWQQLGVVNFDNKDNNGCPRYDYPGVYARTSFYIDWIASTGVKRFVCAN